ncbi:hypothetical protein CGCF415_v015699 [Colletotrichum fructicola]|uniref:uncharacterized protein n=1 Tax=Colletotrichum aenigma TaxID=1215731 RepID=UPI001872BB7E|nr:uncharacterized protein CGCA056_v008322 [Colletotrichum aenigma]KAF4883967.1 hypothetical protein CGCF415_v015699 [Colletotrichum fructicola]KAF4920942.1 hypothetical protein CGCF245_v015674 [Colletotrichum fructicola]KAF5520260.1 hypothetical protein CGCA056_v008322 [Colletotrichum aenigma]
MFGGNFSLFPLLPGEIRDQIWDLSTRPIGSRGVHYFSVLDIRENITSIPHAIRRHVISSTSKHQRQILAVPSLANETSCPSWFDGNQSTYAIDGGLWTACKESRAAMCRRYKPEDWVDLWRKQREHYGNGQRYLCDLIAT